MKKINLLLYSLASVFLLSGCIDKYPYDGCHEPIYISYQDLRTKYPSIKAPREIDKAGKIYIYKELLLVNEKNRGIHIINNKDRQHPKNLYFIEIPGNIDLAVKDGYLYVDSFTDMVVININDLNNIKVVKRKNDIFPYDMYQTLSEEDLKKDRCYPDKNKGVVIGYE